MNKKKKKLSLPLFFLILIFIYLFIFAFILKNFRKKTEMVLFIIFGQSFGFGFTLGQNLIVLVISFQ